MSQIKMTFCPEVAKKVGTDAAIILSNIEFWQATNKANKRNYHDGNYWTYNSVKAFNELFNYLTPAKIRKCLDKLEKEGYIISGNYNASSYDRTKWYCSKRQLHLSELANGVVHNDEPIPYNKPNTKPNDKQLMSSIKIDDLPSEMKMYFEIAEAFRLLFIKNLEESGSMTKHQKNAKFGAYVNEIRLMFSQDGATKEQFQSVFKFLGSPEGDFWKSNILSIKKLREKFPKLIMDASKNKPKERMINRQTERQVNNTAKTNFDVWTTP